MNVSESGEYKNLTASGLVKGDPGRVLGIFVASASSTPTITVYDGDNTSGAVLANTFTPAGATFYPLLARFSSGLYVAISGTVDCTVIYV